MTGVGVSVDAGVSLGVSTGGAVGVGVLVGRVIAGPTCWIICFGSAFASAEGRAGNGIMFCANKAHIRTRLKVFITTPFPYERWLFFWLERFPSPDKSVAYIVQNFTANVKYDLYTFIQ
jgi:hypothetical protein